MRLGLAAVLLVLGSGCSAFAQKQLDGFGYPYDATSEYSRFIECWQGTPMVVLFVPYWIIDFPATLVAETLLLPADLALRKSEPKKPVTCK